MQKFTCTHPKSYSTSNNHLPALPRLIQNDWSVFCMLKAHCASWKQLFHVAQAVNHSNMQYTGMRLSVNLHAASLNHIVTLLTLLTPLLDLS